MLNADHLWTASFTCIVEDVRKLDQLISRLVLGGSVLRCILKRSNLNYLIGIWMLASKPFSVILGRSAPLSVPIKTLIAKVWILINTCFFLGIFFKSAWSINVLRRVSRPLIWISSFEVTCILRISLNLHLRASQNSF